LAAVVVSAGFESMLAVPLLARGRSVGVLTVFSEEPDAFDEEDMELLQTFAAQASLAIDTARLYGREHRVATVLQASIVPERLPKLPGIDAASVYRPAGVEAEIGGDYYDLFPAPDGRLVLVIADVVGKGVVAATKTSMVRYALRGMVAAGLGPSDALASLNRLVCEAGDAGDIVTVCLCYLDVSRSQISWSNAGHPPALVLPAGDHRLERLAPTGPVLGGIDGAQYREKRVSFPPGSVVLLYTDGVTEARRGELFYGEGRVRRALRAGGSAGDVARRLMSSVDRFAEHGLRDDAAVLAVRSDDSGNKE
jgi:serine phosphatase RsbU (regulator of sigma subunit)